MHVGALPPTVVAQTYTGAIGNTELQVGGSGGSGAEVYLGSPGALAGDADPNGGTISATPGTITTAQGGSVTMGADGSFTYEPPAGFTGPSDSFNYTVDESEGPSATAAATIDFTARASGTSTTRRRRVATARARRRSPHSPPCPRRRARHARAM